MVDSTMDVVVIEGRWLEEIDEEGEGGVSSFFSAVATNLLLFFLIFGLSATVELANLKYQLTNKAAIFTGVAMQFFAMPALGFLSVIMLRNTGEFTEAMGITLLVVTASPGGSFSNWWCSLFNAELALSVAMTSVSSILSVALLPANLILYSWLAYVVVMPAETGEEVHILEALDLKSIFTSLGVVMGAILSGMYVGHIYSSPKFHKRANQFGSFCGLLLIVFSAFLGGGGAGGESNFWSLPWAFYVGTAFPCVVGMLIANIVSRFSGLSPPEIVAISIECCYQNVAIATSVAATMFKDPTTRTQAISVPLFYGVVEAVIIFFYCLWAWKAGWTKAPANEKICVVITRTYEIEDPEEDLQSVVPENEQWWFARFFTPRVSDEPQVASAKDLHRIKQPRKQRSRLDTDVTITTEASRSRTNSTEQVNVSFSTSSPPVTPQKDLEAQTLDRLSEEIPMPPFPAETDAPTSPCPSLTIINMAGELSEVEISEHMVEHSERTDCDNPTVRQA